MNKWNNFIIAFFVTALVPALVSVLLNINTDELLYKYNAYPYFSPENIYKIIHDYGWLIMMFYFSRAVGLVDFTFDKNN